jgi:hypothetical protein
MLGTCDTELADALTIQPGSGGDSVSCLDSVCIPRHQLIGLSNNCRINLCISYYDTGRTGLPRGQR